MVKVQVVPMRFAVTPSTTHPVGAPTTNSAKPPTESGTEMLLSAMLAPRNRRTWLVTDAASRGVPGNDIGLPDTLRTTWLAESAMKTSPDGDAARPAGPLSDAFNARSPSPE